MRMPKMFTSVVAAVALMYSSGCSDQNAAGPYQMVPGYGYVPAGAVVDPNTGFVTYPQSYVPGATVYEPAVAYAPVAPAPAKVRKVKPRRKARYNRRNTRFANPGVQYAAAGQGYYLAQPGVPGYTATYVNPGYGTASLLSDPNLVPSITTAPAYAGPVYADPLAAAPVATPVPAGPTVTVTKYAATAGAEQIAQVAGANCGTTYRRGRRVKVARTPRPAGYVPYTVVSPVPAPAPVPAVTYAVPYSGVYGPGEYVAEAYSAPVYAPAAVSPVYTDPLPAATYTPTPLPEEPEAAPAAPAPEPAPEPATPAEPAVVKTAEVDIDKLAEAVAEKLSETLAAAAQKLAESARPAEAAQQPVVIQPIIQPIVQAPEPQYAAPIPVPEPVPALIQEPMPMAVPFMPTPAMQGPIVSEPLSAMVSVPGAASGFEPGVLNSYCPPEICPVPNAVVCAPGQNLSECFTMNDYQLQNTPVQVLRPDVAAPLGFPPAGTTIMSQPITSQSPTAEAGKYQSLAPQTYANQTLSVRPSVAPPEVNMPAPLGGTTTPPFPATTEIESALDAMLSRDARTPNLK